jgi:hypothetical protein
VCALYNHIVVTDPKEPERTLRAHLYQQPAADYNAVTIDFVVFKELKDCQRLIQAAYDPRIQYVLFVRHNQVKLYPIVDFLQQILSIPVV